MTKRKKLFSCLGGLAASFALTFAIFIPGTKVSAKLAVETIDYQNSTITVSTDSDDSVLYFSDSKKKKWETALDSFDGSTKKCTMDISWISLTKDYIITLKGDKSNTSDDILTLTIPKQVSNFKAKYDKRAGKVNFTNDNSREIEYRKNNTSEWNDVPRDANNAIDTVALSSILKRLCDNGASVYFRLKAENGTATDPGKRYSKEVACAITKKTNAPKITINSDATISVDSGLQVRRVNVEKAAGLLYVTDYRRIDGISDTDVDDKKWYTYQISKDVPVTEMVNDIASGSTSTVDEVYLQFKKAATSTTQESRITTLRIPRQEAAPSINDAGISMEFTSSTGFKLTFSNASTGNPYEYCAVDDSDVKKGSNNQAIDMISSGDASWKTVNTSTGIEIKKADAPDHCWIFFRKKSVGTVGEDDFKLSTPYSVYTQINYPSGVAGTINLNSAIELIDGVCNENNAGGHQTFTINTSYNAQISKIVFSTAPNPKTVADATAATAKVTSTIVKNGDSNYIITATITDLKLDPTISSNLQNGIGVDAAGKLKLYGFILFSNNESISSNDSTGLRINLSQKSEIDKTGLSGQNKVEVQHFVGITTTTPGGVTSNNYDFYFNVKYGNNGTNIKDIKFGNYGLTKGIHYETDGGSPVEKVTIKMKAMEDDPDFASYYNKTQNLIIELDNGEKLTDVKLTLLEPVSLDKTYAWAFSRNSLLDTKQEITTINPDGTVTTTQKNINNYSVSYQQSSASSNNGSSSISVQEVSFTSAMIKNVDITDNGGAGKIEFNNTRLKTVPSVFSEPVVITFTVKYSNGTTCEYKMRRGCTFTII